MISLHESHYLKQAPRGGYRFMSWQGGLLFFMLPTLYPQTCTAGTVPTMCCGQEVIVGKKAHLDTAP